ncbi:MAG TPA: OmpA family protein [Candidatus Sulfotelmatobacter sp.]|nr:OmpA family protein [Candidatus Sulfotelmatobacter sp.]
MTNKFIYLTAFALAAVILSTGCAHKAPPVTPLPGPTVTDTNPNPLPPAPPINPNDNVVSTNGITEGGPWDPNQYDQDRTTLAADTIHFDFDSAVIRDSEKDNLTQVAAALQSDKTVKLMIEGNCDERGTEEYNRSLGERRAEAAREALVGMGIDPARIHTLSYGKDKPVDNGHDEAAWSKNRRDDFVLWHPKTGA